jgi:hypothetical protein
VSGVGTVLPDARPAPRRFDLARPGDRSLAVAIAVAAGLALLIWSPSVGGRPPGDPAGVAADARLARCGGAIDDVEFAFAIPHARDYQAYLPAMERASELDEDASALIVVYRGAFPLGGAAATPPPADTTLRNLCIYVGQAGQGTLNYYGAVSVAGLRATPTGPTLVAAPAT